MYRTSQARFVELSPQTGQTTNTRLFRKRVEILHPRLSYPVF